MHTASKKIRLSVIAMFLYLNEVDGHSCNALYDNSKEDWTDRYMSTVKLDEISPSGFGQCQKACLLHHRCLSINYLRDSLQCELNSASATDVLNETEPRVGSVYKDKQQLMANSKLNGLLGVCSNHNCSSSTRCVAMSTEKSKCQPACTSRCTREDYHLIGHNCWQWCLKLNNNIMNETDANAGCKKEGGRLVEVNSAAKVSVLRAYLLDNSPEDRRIIGGRLFLSDNTFRWNSGEDIWKGVHIQGNTGNCMQLYYDQFHDVNCSARQKSICEEVFT